MPSRKETKEPTPEHIRSVELITYLLDNSEFKKPSHLAKALGLTPSGLGDVKSMRILFNKATKELLKRGFGVNLDWLQFGEGEMINGENHNVPTHSIKHDNLKGIPVYDISIMAGPGDIFLDKMPEPVSYMFIPGFEDCDLVVQVYGDSMAPAFNASEYVILKRIDHEKVIQFGQPHYIKTTDFAVLKYPQTNPDKNKLTLRSENTLYEPFEIEKQSVISMFLARGKFTKLQN